MTIFIKKDWKYYVFIKLRFEEKKYIDELSTNKFVMHDIKTFMTNLSHTEGTYYKNVANISTIIHYKDIRPTIGQTKLKLPYIFWLLELVWRCDWGITY